MNTVSIKKKIKVGDTVYIESWDDEVIERVVRKIKEDSYIGNMFGTSTEVKFIYNMLYFDNNEFTEDYNILDESDYRVKKIKQEKLNVVNNLIEAVLPEDKRSKENIKLVKSIYNEIINNKEKYIL